MNSVLYSTTITVSLLLITSSINVGIIENKIITNEMYSDINETLKNNIQY